MLLGLSEANNGCSVRADLHGIKYEDIRVSIEEIKFQIGGNAKTILQYY